MRVWTRRAGAIGFVLLAWQLVSHGGWVPREYFPDVPQIVDALVRLTVSGELIHAERVTLARTVVGVVVSSTLGFGLALLGAQVRAVRYALAPLVDIFQALPPAALVPLTIFALGFGEAFFLFVTCFAATWPVYIAAIRALTASELVQIQSGQSLGFTSMEILLQVRIPAALPEIFTGVRVAAGISLIATVASEMLAGRDGIGFMLFDTAFALRVDDTFAVLFVAAANGVLINALVVALRHQLLGWHEKLSLSA
ncbi:ABC transporter permease [Paraburkholderia strydomiana]|uniref:ABC transporter permease n=1 Tax=Paraburkholderia strydomiana TaxID=1245417 RepID=UPI001BEB20F1|nr:ABC transporter permease [Paraburkholderia strydomiana]MBT2792086.1 ABC transporter permease [Paraburkholderia strydomiana]